MCQTTICHVEQIDDDKFQFVRRMENIMSSKPLYEKIIVDRKNGQVHGYTFENLSDEKYSEHFVYQRMDEQVNYDMFLFRNPGLKRLLRSRMHGWGVQKLEKIMHA